MRSCFFPFPAVCVNKPGSTLQLQSPPSMRGKCPGHHYSPIPSSCLPHQGHTMHQKCFKPDKYVRSLLRWQPLCFLGQCQTTSATLGQGVTPAQWPLVFSPECTCRKTSLSWNFNVHGHHLLVGTPKSGYFVNNAALTAWMWQSQASTQPAFCSSCGCGARGEQGHLHLQRRIHRGLQPPLWRQESFMEKEGTQ